MLYSDTMEHIDIREIVTRTAHLVEQHYVFADVGAQVAGLLATKADTYVAHADPKELAHNVTADLQSVNGDKHLRLSHSETELPIEDGDASADYAKIIQESHRTGGGIARVERLDGNIGVLTIRPQLFPPSVAGAAMAAAMNLLASVDALIVDVRDCPGGDPSMVALAATYLLGEESVRLNDLYERAGDNLLQSWTLPYVPGPRFGGTKPLYVLTGKGTFSAGEDLAYTLQQLGRATVVGERTGGGAHPRRGFRVHPHLMASIPVARTINRVSGTNWEGVGVAPDLETAADDALGAALRDARNRLVPVS